MEELSSQRRKCCELFDSFWKDNGEKERRRWNLHIRLAGEMGLELPECDFAQFDQKQLKQAYRILERWKKHPPEELDYEPASYPCNTCFLADWNDMYGVMVFCCDMSRCVKADEEEENW